MNIKLLYAVCVARVTCKLYVSLLNVHTLISEAFL